MNKKRIKQLADYAVRKSTEHTADGRWKISYVELRSRFGIDVSDVNENGKMLEKELRQREEINELIMTEDAIEMTCHLEYCPNCCEGGINGATHLISLMGCNLYDEHDEAPAEELSDESQTQALSI
ncbi:hypothetical protein NE579_07445 [Intestinimonas massiliensis]|uniref:Uncharacterized protein n=1 Tax=Intestinimonas massiliensis (ex Afouda et al. 2020) TaxID=1673721 RepID=A0AAW5JN51_9FIRM|nr:hypothetical protein [Intestinimonas massiliensis (ex Afouda et al. 2020)]MCQ4770295.1 hypothetical protein [Intestinimonas massiliensis (ex Afouda et al. 2020)]